MFFEKPGGRVVLSAGPEHVGGQRWASRKRAPEIAGDESSQQPWDATQGRQNPILGESVHDDVHNQMD